MKHISGSSKPLLAKNLLVKNVESVTYLFDSFSGYIYRLNKTGTLVAKLSDGNNAVSEIVEELTKIYDVDSKTALRDVASFLNTLAEYHLLEGS